MNKTELCLNHWFSHQAALDRELCENRLSSIQP
jgi:hypothetical protein